MSLLYLSYYIDASFLREAVMLERMVKSTVIFSDQDQNKKEEKNFHKPVNEKVSISRDEYRQLIKDAYHEGREDALKEHQKQNTSQQEREPDQKLMEKGPKRFSQQKEEKRERFKATTVPDQEKDTLELKGKEEAMRIHARQKQENLQRFKTITARHEIEILRAKGVFPFSLFPDTLIIDTTKVTVAKKQLFATEHITTIPLKDVGDVTVQTALFLASITLTYMPQLESPGITQPIKVTIPSLQRSDAIRAKNILKGAIVAKAEEIDIAKLPPDEVVKVLEKFGQSEGVD